jgi:branched-chain amino acid transport system permease protein
MLHTFAIQLINGITQGMMYAMVAIGLTMIYGVMRVLHIAHAAVYVFGAYIGLLFFDVTHNLFVAIVLSMICSGFLGILIEYFIYRRIAEKSRTVVLIASIGLLIFITDAIRLVAGPLERAFPAKIKFSLPSGLSALGVAEMKVVILSITAVVIFLLWAFMTRTKIGFGIRALAQNREIASAMGINVERCISIVFFASSAMAAVGGVLIGVYYNLVAPYMGDVVAYKALAIIVIGGFGSILGTIIGGLCLGISETFIIGYTNIQFSREGIAMLFLVLLILFRPNGILGKGERR